MLKSPELTGRWEKKLREIEYHKYSASQFIEELKQMVQQIVLEVLQDNSSQHVAYTETEKGRKGSRTRTTKTATSKAKPKAPGQASAGTTDPLVGQPCPVCGKGVIIKGKTAYGCSEWKNGCTFRKPFEQ